MTTTTTKPSTSTLGNPAALSNLLKEKVSKAVRDNLSQSGFLLRKTETVAREVLKEGLILLPKVFGWKTERVSGASKEAHERLYNGYVQGFNRASGRLDTTREHDLASFRDLKVQEQWNLNAVKLHELYFTNIADPTSQIHMDSLPYVRLCRDFGTFDRWQADFRGCCMAAREGWAVCVYEPFKGVYMNVVVDGHTQGIPLGAVPVMVMDMWSHAYFKDYIDDKLSYVDGMLLEMNWTVVEARMILAERSQLDVVYKCVPVVNTAPETTLNAAAREASGPVQPQMTMAPAEMVSKAQGIPPGGQVV